MRGGAGRPNSGAEAIRRKGCAGSFGGLGAQQQAGLGGGDGGETARKARAEQSKTATRCGPLAPASMVVMCGGEAEASAAQRSAAEWCTMAAPGAAIASICDARATASPCTLMKPPAPHTSPPDVEEQVPASLTRKVTFPVAMPIRVFVGTGGAPAFRGE